MKKISCDIIRDLLPLYLDEVVSDDTRELVEEHLETCDSCKKEADILKRNIALPTNRNIKLSDSRVLKKLRNRLLRKKVIVSILSIAASIAVVMGTYVYMSFTESFIPYDSTDIRIEEAGGELYISYNGKYLAGSAGINNTPVVIDGEEKNVIVLGYYETLWSKYVEPIFVKPQKGDGRWCLGSAAKIDQVYYAEFNLNSYLDDCNYSRPPKNWDYEYMIEHSKKIWGK